MNIVKVADGAYFVPSYSMQTLTASYDQMTAQQILHGSDDGGVEDATKEANAKEEQTIEALTCP